MGLLLDLASRMSASEELLATRQKGSQGGQPQPNQAPKLVLRLMQASAMHKLIIQNISTSVHIVSLQQGASAPTRNASAVEKSMMKQRKMVMPQKN